MANANAHFDPKVLTFLQDTSSANPHADSGNARALEKSGALGRLNVAMYICLRTTLWTLLTLKGNLWALQRIMDIQSRAADAAAGRTRATAPPSRITSSL